MLNVTMNPEESCIFCKIIAGKIPCYKVYEDDQFLAFLDISPKNKGHTLLIPKTHYRWVWDIQESYAKALNTIAKKLKKVFNTDRVISFIIGDEVPHAHIHLVPRFDGDRHGALIDLEKSIEVTPNEMKEIAEKILNA